MTNLILGIGYAQEGQFEQATAEQEVFSSLYRPVLGTTYAMITTALWGNSLSAFGISFGECPLFLRFCYWFFPSVAMVDQSRLEEFTSRSPSPYHLYERLSDLDGSDQPTISLNGTETGRKENCDYYRTEISCFLFSRRGSM
jgi:hypothetical protein